MLRFSLFFLSIVNAQNNLFNLPNIRGVPKPQIPPEYAHFFDLSGSARSFVDTIIGPRPGGIFPEKNFQIAGSGVSPQQAYPGFIPKQNPNGGYQLPPGFGQGLTFSGSENQASIDPTSIAQNNRVDQTGSSIGGIPNIYPNLPKAPVPRPHVSQQLPNIPKIHARPEVPQGGLGPLESFGNQESQYQPPQGIPQTPFNNQPLVQQSVNPGQPGGQDNILGGLLNLIGLNNLGQNQAVKGFEKLLGYGQKNDNGVLSSVIYKTLTDGAIQNNENSKNSTNITDSLVRTAASSLGSNVELIQQLLTQPNSPFCNPKPQPVTSFDVDAFMGTWYQVLYSPPLSPGPCSMVAYKKLADVANGGPGTVFDTFEYTTEGTPYGRPQISSGYAIVRAPGQLIYRTTSSTTDVNVHVIAVGPLNDQGQYDYTVLSVNCNYPLHVFARDPVQYKQKYEGQVNGLLEQKGLINGFSRLLNIVAPVDSTLCNFPPTLFNIQG